jgi:hypothetical protein
MAVYRAMPGNLVISKAAIASRLTMTAEHSRHAWSRAESGCASTVAASVSADTCALRAHGQSRITHQRN